MKIHTEPFESYNYGEWYAIQIKLKDFKNELVERSSQYLGKLQK